MKFTRGIVDSLFEGDPVERQAVNSLLKFEGEDSYLGDDNLLLTGLVDMVRERLQDKFTVESEDLYSYDHPTNIKDIVIPDDFIPLDDPSHRLRPYQIKAAKKAIIKGRGITEIATGGGKTEVLAVILKYLVENGFVRNVYIIAETRFLMNQAYDRFVRRGIENVARFGGGYQFDDSAQIQVCVVDSVRRAVDEENPDFCVHYRDCDLIAFDECHHLSAKSWVKIGRTCPAKYRYGFTATSWNDPFNFTYSDFKLVGLTGDVITYVPSKVLREKGWLAEPFVTMLNVNRPPVQSRTWAKYYEAGIVRHPLRNSFIASLGCSLYQGRYKTLIFVKMISHGLLLTRILRELDCVNSRFIRGGELSYEWLPSGRWRIRKTSIEELSSYVRDNEQAIIVANQVVDEGIDIPSFNALIMGTAMKKYRRTIQRIGRGMRAKVGDNSVYIFDFLDAIHETLAAHSVYRMQTYELEEYEFSKSLEDTATRMKVPLILNEGLYAWEDLTPKRKRRKSRRST